MSDPARKDAHLWERDGFDWYVEPELSSHKLFRVEPFQPRIWDPCAGGGNIVRQAILSGYQAEGTDVVDRSKGAPWFAGLHDFLDGPQLDPTCDIISNPPFFGAKGTEKFIRVARAMPNVRKIAVFTNRKFATGRTRAIGLFAEHVPARIWEITPRPSCPPGVYLEAGNKAGGGAEDFCWIIWEGVTPPNETRWGLLI